MKKMLFVLLVGTSMIFTSCKKDDTPAANEITDGSGLRVQLNWTLNDGSNPNTSVDVDFYIYKGLGAAKEASPRVSGNNSGTFEDETFAASLPDGDYTVQIHYFDVLKAGKFNLLSKGASVDKSYNIENSFTTSNDGQFVDFAKINKSGTKFTISKL
jgi:hypothetical protein